MRSHFGSEKHHYRKQTALKATSNHAAPGHERASHRVPGATGASSSRSTFRRARSSAPSPSRNTSISGHLQQSYTCGMQVAVVLLPIPADHGGTRHYDVTSSLSSLDINGLESASLGRANVGLSSKVLVHSVTSLHGVGRRATYVGMVNWGPKVRCKPVIHWERSMLATDFAA
jgi:hypothetical protein